MGKGAKQREAQVADGVVDRNWARTFNSQEGRKLVGWWEEYGCGCVSETVPRKRDLPGYCPIHGEDRRLGPLREYA